MFTTPPPLTRQQWVYDDPSGVAEPSPYARPWPRREPRRSRRPAVRLARVVHREG
jgi:hypothetical protein